MPKTTVGLFEKHGPLDGVVCHTEALGLPRKEARTWSRTVVTRCRSRDYHFDAQ